MAVLHDGSKKEKEDIVSIEPLVLNNIVVKTIKREIISPVIVKVDIEKPVFIEKTYEKPIVIEKEYEKPIVIEKEYEKPITVKKEYELPVLIKKEYIQPLIKNKEYEKPIVIEKTYEKPIVIEKEYELPLVNGEEFKKIINESREMLSEVKTLLMDLRVAVRKVKESIPDQIKIPKIVHEEVIVKDVNIIEETIHVIGKVITKKG